MNELVPSDDEIRLFCSFRTEGRLYGIDAMQVREVSAQVTCTPVLQAPPAVRGLANLRSRIYLVVDVRPVLGLAPMECTSDSRLIVLKPHLAENLGILVEHGGDMIRVKAEEIEAAPPPAADTAESSCDRTAAITTGVCKLEGELMNIVDAAKLVKAVEAGMQ
jgi:purine-binding chemotaxis protein CheW